MEPQAIIILTMTLPGVIASAVVALNAKRINVAMRAQRAQRAAARAAHGAATTTAR